MCSDAHSITLRERERERVREACSKGYQILSFLIYELQKDNQCNQLNMHFCFMDMSTHERHTKYCSANIYYMTISRLGL